MKQPALVAAGILVFSLRAWFEAPAEWKAHDITRPRPPILKPADQKLPVQPPADAVVLFEVAIFRNGAVRTAAPPNG